MLSTGEDVEADALFKRGWKVSAIARHLGRDRGTIANYLSGKSQPGVRRSSAPDPLAPFVAYVKARFVDDPHVWASALFTRSSPSATAVRIRASSARCVWPGCAPIARRVRGEGPRYH